MSMKKSVKIVLIIAAVVCALPIGALAIVYHQKNKEEEALEIYGPLQPERIERIGKHIYYKEDMYAFRNLDKEEKNEIILLFNKIDDNVDVDLYIIGFSKNYITGNYRVNAFQYMNGAIIPSLFYVSDGDADNPVMKLNDDEKEPLNYLDTSDLYPVQDVIPDIVALAEKHADSLYYEDYNNKEITGTFRLEYDVLNELLYYSFTINECSEVRVDAKTGDILLKHFWDGVMED